MYRQLNDVYELKNDVYELKKQLRASNDENQLLKVKIQKLYSEMRKKDKSIEALIDPKRSSQIKKVMLEKDSGLIVNLRFENDKLKNLLAERDCIIRRLQNEAQLKRVYGTKFTSSRDRSKSANTRGKFKSLSLNEVNKIPNTHIQDRNIRSDDKVYLPYCNSETKLNTCNIRDQYDGLTQKQLLSILDNRRCINRDVCSPNSDIERFELQQETPHEEISQLQNFYVEMVTEVDQLKYTIIELRKEHDDTAKKLKQRDVSIKVMANEIEQMKMGHENRKVNTKDDIESPNKNEHKPLISSNISNQIIEEAPSTVVEEDLEDIPEELVTSFTDTDSLNTEINCKNSHSNSLIEGTKENCLQENNDKNLWTSKESKFFIQNIMNVDEIRKKKFSKLVEEMEKSKLGNVNDA